MTQCMFESDNHSTVIFDINKYLGKWYELAHYPSWFQRNDNYNTTAIYSLTGENTIKVTNSTIAEGNKIESIGVAHYLGGMNLRVDFPNSEVNKLLQSHEFNSQSINI